MTTVHVLYRFYDNADQLLYVGLTINPGRRMEKHRDTKPWWGEVTKVTMAQYPDLPALQGAERAAIKAEKPLHNIRMNGANGKPAPLAITVEKETFDGLVGRWFHSWRPAHDDDSEHVTKRGGKVLEWQGQVVDRDTGIYIVQTYSWWDGNPHSEQIVTTEDMRPWTFYDSALEMQCALRCRESGHLSDPMRTCGGECTHVAWLFDSPNNTVCHNCARFYAKTTEIVWRDGKPVLK